MDFNKILKGSILDKISRKDVSLDDFVNLLKEVYTKDELIVMVTDIKERIKKENNLDSRTVNAFLSYCNELTNTNETEKNVVVEKKFTLSFEEKLNECYDFLSQNNYLPLYKEQNVLFSNGEVMAKWLIANKIQLKKMSLEGNTKADAIFRNRWNLGIKINKREESVDEKLARAKRMFDDQTQTLEGKDIDLNQNYVIKSNSIKNKPISNISYGLCLINTVSQEKINSFLMKKAKRYRDEITNKIAELNAKIKSLNEQNESENNTFKH